MDNVVRNSQLFDKWLCNCGLTYKDVYRHLNENGITDYNNVISKSGYLQEEDNMYFGKKDYHGCDEGLRTHAEKVLDCEIGNIQERLFCIDNKDFKLNENATHYGVQTDDDIMTKNLDFIHIPTGREVEFKVSYYKTINEEYNTVIYRHRDGKFADFMRNGNIIIIYFPYLDKVAVFDKNNFIDPDKTGPKRAVRIIKTENQYGKLWNIVSIWKGMLMDYHMMKEGNSEISEKITRMCTR